MPQKTLHPLATMFPVAALLLVLFGNAAIAREIEDANGALWRSEAPASAIFKLSRSQMRAAREGRLGFQAGRTPDVIEAQWDLTSARATWIATTGTNQSVKIRLQSSSRRFENKMTAAEDPVSGQIDMREGNQHVLRYNYRAIQPRDIAAIQPASRIYAKARSDYIHPLFGLSGEELTQDWSPDHPHHRGIYWAWPEVGFNGELGDLHALQKVFARPAGRIRLESGPVFAQITAENEWRWEDRDPIVREKVMIRAYHATHGGRIIDLAFRFEALKNGVTLARRDTDKYGGLNVRFTKINSMKIFPFVDEPGSTPRRAWAEVSGQSGAFKTGAALVMLQHAGNPDYPGDWVQYPHLPWCQPTFPRTGTRFVLEREKPLVLRYRLCVRETGVSKEIAGALWDAFNTPSAPREEFNIAQ